jgi:hypothetical protein
LSNLIKDCKNFKSLLNEIQTSYGPLKSFLVENEYPPMTEKQLIIQIEKDVKRTFGYKKYFKEINPG